MNRRRSSRDLEEHISALLDGEAPGAAVDIQNLKSDTEGPRRFQQYQRMSALLKTLPSPEVSQDFADRVLRQVEGCECAKPFPWLRYAVAASFILAAGVYGLSVFWNRAPSTSDAPTVVATYESETPVGTDEETEDAFWVYLADEADYHGMSLSLNALETMSEETLLQVLAEITCTAAAPEVLLDSGQILNEADDLWWIMDSSTSFVELLDFVDTLDQAEADALNEALRTALTEA